MWKHWESNHAQQTCTDAMISHQHATWEEDLLYYCIDGDWDINLESTLSPKGIECLHAMIIVDTVAKTGGLWSCKIYCGIRSEWVPWQPKPHANHGSGRVEAKSLTEKACWEKTTSSERSKEKQKTTCLQGERGTERAWQLSISWEPTGLPDCLPWDVHILFNKSPLKLTSSVGSVIAFKQSPRQPPIWCPLFQYVFSSAPRVENQRLDYCFSTSPSPPHTHKP